jgi:hypothetical protein
MNSHGERTSNLINRPHHFLLDSYATIDYYKWVKIDLPYPSIGTFKLLP